jgi:hypothetical protein
LSGPLGFSTPRKIQEIRKITIEVTDIKRLRSF